MRRLGDVRLPPLAWVAVAAAVTAVVRFALALQVRTPIYYPDEYRTAELARSIAEGGLPRIRGEFLDFSFITYVPSLIQAPVWLVEDVEVSYRLAQALGCAAFAAAAFPAFALARRVGVSEGGSIAVAVLALVVPAGAFSGTLIAEPFAYTAFLLAVLLAVRALTRATLSWQITMAVVAIALCFIAGIQFAFFGFAYAVVWAVFSVRTTRERLRRAALVSMTVAAVVAAASIATSGSWLNTLEATASNFDYDPAGLLRSLGANAFVLAVAAGWVLVPAAIIGLYRFARSDLPESRSFGRLSIALLVAMLIEAAVMSEAYGLHERFTFYGAPLLAISFMRFAETAVHRRTVYATICYATAFAALLIPLVEEDRLTTGIDHSPTLVGLWQLLFGAEFGALLWSPVLVLAGIVLAARVVTAPRILVPIAVAVCAFVTLGTSASWITGTHELEPPPRLDAPDDSALVTWAGASRAFTLEALFWNRDVSRVLVLQPGSGSTRAPDGYAFTRVHLASRGFVDVEDDLVNGPFVFGPDTVTDATARETDRWVVLGEPPTFLSFGSYRDSGDISSYGLLFAATRSRPARVSVKLSAEDPGRFFVACVSGFERTIDIGPRPAAVVVPVSADSVAECEFGLVTGTINVRNGRQVVGRGAISLTKT